MSLNARWWYGRKGAHWAPTVVYLRRVIEITICARRVPREVLIRQYCTTWTSNIDFIVFKLAATSFLPIFNCLKLKGWLSTLVDSKDVTKSKATSQQMTSYLSTQVSYILLQPMSNHIVRYTIMKSKISANDSLSFTLQWLSPKVTTTWCRWRPSVSVPMICNPGSQSSSPVRR